MIYNVNFLIYTTIIAEVDLQQLLCTHMCLSFRGNLLNHKKGAHVGGIRNIAHYDPFKVTVEAFAFQSSE